MEDKNTRIAYRGNSTVIHAALPHALSPGLAARDLVEFALAVIGIELGSLHYKFSQAELELLAGTVDDKPMCAEDRFRRWGLDLPAALSQFAGDGVTPESAYALIGEVEALGKTQQAALTIALERYRALGVSPKSFAQAGVVPRFTDTHDSSHTR